MLSFFTKRLATGISALKPNLILNILNNAYSTEIFNKLPWLEKSFSRPVYRDKMLSWPESPLKCRSVTKKLWRERPDCSVNKRLTWFPCNYNRNEKKKDLNIYRRARQFKDYAWEYTDDSCGNPRPEKQPRFDTIYYTPSNKAKRQYQQTWVDCPPLVAKKNKVCCNDPTELPPIRRRRKPQYPMTASEFEPQKLKFISKIATDKRCPFIRPPFCFKGYYPPKCHILKGLSGCSHRKSCPYPSFSECCREYVHPPKNMECLCATTSPSCLAFRYLKRKLLYNMAPPLPNWPPNMIGANPS